MATENFNKHASSAALSAHSNRAKVYHDLSYNDLRNKMSRAADKDLAADYPMGTKAYKVTLHLKDHSRPKEKYLMVEPQINKEAEKQDLRRQTMAFANTEAKKDGMKPDELKGLNIKVEQVPLEMYQEKTRQKSIRRVKGIER
jgi:2-methylcitrate dehydratase PrpD